MLEGSKIVELVIRKLIRKAKKPTLVSRKPNVVLDTVFTISDKPGSILVVKAVNRPGILAKISKIISDEGINILKVSVLEHVSRTGYIMFLLEDCDQDCVRNVSDKIKNSLSEEIEDITYSSSKDSYVFLKYGSIFFLDKQATILTTDFIRYVVVELMKTYNLSTVKNILKKIGYGIGKAIYEKFIMENLNTEEKWEYEVDRALNYLADFYKALGLGDMSIEKIGDIRYRIVVEDNFECLSMRNYSLMHKTGYMTSGVLAGYLTSLLNRRVIVHEEKCINDRGKHCVFEVEIYEGLYKA
ncbi:MAG: hypothetical protein B6U89_04335 [Desulfurococcales archaeon ex4484_58]|nr:MAG: hypothetical protein B6U89_04335 [Desulfurococcales archaeon ex4484_58]